MDLVRLTALGGLPDLPGGSGYHTRLPHGAPPPRSNLTHYNTCPQMVGCTHGLSPPPGCKHFRVRIFFRFVLCCVRWDSGRLIVLPPVPTPITWHKTGARRISVEYLLRKIRQHWPTRKGFQTQHAAGQSSCEVLFVFIFVFLVLFV